MKRFLINTLYKALYRLLTVKENDIKIVDDFPYELDLLYLALLSLPYELDYNITLFKGVIRDKGGIKKEVIKYVN